MRLGLVMALLLLNVGAHASAPCRIPGHDTNPKITFSPSAAEPLYGQSMSKRTLTAQNSVLGIGQNELGVTTWRTAFSLSPKVRFLVTGNGRNCAMLESLDVNFRIEDMRVEIANDYAANSCAYGEIRAHEDTHVRLTRQAFSRAAADMRRAIISAVNDFGITSTAAPNVDMAANEMTVRLQARLMPVVNEYEREARFSNAGIDTKENYARVRARCKDW